MVVDGRYICHYAHEGIELQFQPKSDPPSVNSRSLANGRPNALDIGDAFLLQDDNTRPHMAHIVDAYLQQETIQCLQW
ncbi:hypothetical protein TNCV_349281 [Trichonephila clavipes]|nr:hypothetical protein TNCV_349281 [Trichonephila clavipes]